MVPNPKGTISKTAAVEAWPAPESSSAAGDARVAPDLHDLGDLAGVVHQGALGQPENQARRSSLRQAATNPLDEPVIPQAQGG